MGIFDWLFGKKKTIPKNEKDVKKPKKKTTTKTKKKTTKKTNWGKKYPSKTLTPKQKDLILTGKFPVKPMICRDPESTSFLDDLKSTGTEEDKDVSEEGGGLTEEMKINYDRMWGTEEQEYDLDGTKEDTEKEVKKPKEKTTTKPKNKIMKLQLEQLGIETTLEKFIEDWGNIDELENIKEEIESNEYYEDEDYDYYIEKEDGDLVVTFTGDGNGFLDLYFEIDKKYNSKVMFFEETRYKGNDENGVPITYIEWEYEYNPELFKLDIPSVLFKESGFKVSDYEKNKNIIGKPLFEFHNPIIVCKNFRIGDKEKWINKEEEETFYKLKENENINLNGKYTIKEIISLDNLNEDNWYDKLKSIGYGEGLPKEKPDLN